MHVCSCACLQAGTLWHIQTHTHIFTHIPSTVFSTGPGIRHHKSKLGVSLLNSSQMGPAHSQLHADAYI